MSSPLRAVCGQETTIKSDGRYAVGSVLSVCGVSLCGQGGLSRRNAYASYGMANVSGVVGAVRHSTRRIGVAISGGEKVGKTVHVSEGRRKGCEVVGRVPTHASTIAIGRSFVDGYKVGLVSRRPSSLSASFFSAVGRVAEERARNDSSSPSGLESPTYEKSKTGDDAKELTS